MTPYPRQFYAHLLGLMLWCVLLVPNLVEASEKWLSDWEDIGERDGIHGECRQHHSKINQCRLTTIVNADLSALTALLLDGNGVSTWAPNTLSSEEIPEMTDGPQVTVYMTYNFPGAVNRDTVTRSVAEQNPETQVVTIKFHSVNIQGPKKDLRLVRFPLMAGSWTMTPLAPGKTKIQHLNLSLPGGLVQSNLYYLYNLGTKDASFDTLIALKKAVRQDKYQNAQLPFIKNFSQ